jgi:hypothetical protein
MAFELTEYNEATLATFTKRVEKHGDEDVQAVSMGLEIATENFVLDLLDPTLRHALYKAKDEAQDDVPDVVPTTPVLRSSSIDKVTLPNKHEGWTLEVDDGIDEDNPMKFGGVKLSKFNVEPKQGGTVVLRFTAGTSDIDADRLGRMGMHHGSQIWIKLHAPKLKPEAIDGSPEGGGPGFETDDGDDEKDAGQLFAEEHGAG